MSVYQLVKSEENNSLLVVCEGKNLFPSFLYYANILLHKLAKGYVEYTKYP